MCHTGPKPLPLTPKITCSRTSTRYRRTSCSCTRKFTNQRTRGDPFVYIDATCSYLQKKHKNGEITEGDDEGSDVDSVASEEFEEMLGKMPGFKDMDGDFDFMNDIGEKLKAIKKSKKGGTSSVDNEEDFVSDEEQSDVDDLDEDDDDVNDDLTVQDEDLDDSYQLDEDKDLLDGLDDDEMSDIVFDSDEESDGAKKPKRKNKKGKELNSIFASADEFAALLEEEGASGKAPGTSSAYSNKDKAGE